MKKLSLALALGLSATMSGLAVYAADSTTEAVVAEAPEIQSDLPKEVLAKIQAALEPVSAHVPITAVRNSGMKGLYEVILTNEQVLYINEDGSHFVVGDMYHITDEGLDNLSEAAKEIARTAFNKVRKAEMAKLEPASLITYSPEKDIVAKVVIFTDVDCPYCRKLHADMDGYNDLGIEVSYAAFPRAGIGSNSFNKMVSAWCAEDKNDAMDQLKKMRRIPAATCENPVEWHLSLGETIGVRGTPAIITEDGEMIPGYLPPRELAARLGLPLEMN